MNFLYFAVTFLLILIVIGLLIALALLALRLWVHLRVRSKVYELDQTIPETDVAIVLGAALWADGSPTPVLYDRVATGVELFKSGRVNTLLMSGDGQHDSYNEPNAMQRLAVQMDVPEERIAVDYAGLSTYESLLRARRIYHLDRITLVTQRFHIDRALYLADRLGLNAIAVNADRRRYRFLALQRSRLREIVATAKAWLDLRAWQRRADEVDDSMENTSG